MSNGFGFQGTSHQVSESYVVGYPAGDLAKELVANVVSTGLVDFSERPEVQGQDRDGASMKLRPQQ